VVMNGVDFYMCPTCDQDVMVGSKECPHCAKSLESEKKRRKVLVVKREWEEDESLGGLDLPDDGFDYNDFILREFGEGVSNKRVGVHPVWWWTALVLVVGIVCLIAFGYW